MTGGGEKGIGRKVGVGGGGGDDTKCEKVSLLKPHFLFGSVNSDVRSEGRSQPATPLLEVGGGGGGGGHYFFPLYERKGKIAN